MYRISRNRQEPIIDVAKVEAIEPAIRSSEPGEYHVDEIGADGLRRGNSTTPLERV
jgi:anti-sigma28 factor (negative regulator of flagellin synthesis)